jgi:hypothetical protein
MPATLNLALTDELRAFVDSNAGDGTLYSTPGEFVRAVLPKRKMRWMLQKSKMASCGAIKTLSKVTPFSIQDQPKQIMLRFVPGGEKAKSDAP